MCYRFLNDSFRNVKEFIFHVVPIYLKQSLNDNESILTNRELFSQTIEIGKSLIKIATVSLKKSLTMNISPYLDIAWRSFNSLDLILSPQFRFNDYFKDEKLPIIKHYKSINNNGDEEEDKQDRIIGIGIGIGIDFDGGKVGDEYGGIANHGPWQKVLLELLLHSNKKSFLTVNNELNFINIIN